MKSTMYGCFRYFLVPFDQISFNQILVKDKKVLFENIINNIDTKDDFSQDIYNRNINNDKYKLYLIRKIDVDTYMFKFGKHSYTKQYTDIGNDIKENKVDNYPFIYIIINTKSQIILFERKSGIFKTPSSSAKALERHLKPFLSENGYEFKIDELSESKSFWSLINNAETIGDLYQVSLTLKSPNLFGGSTDAEEIIRELYGATQSTENILTFKNNKGKLHLKKRSLKTFIEYITSGGGKWSVKASIPGTTKKTFSSKDNVKIIQLPQNIELIDNDITDKIKSTIDDLNTKPGDDIVDMEDKSDN